MTRSLTPVCLNQKYGAARFGLPFEKVFNETAHKDIGNKNIAITLKDSLLTLSQIPAVFSSLNERLVLFQKQLRTKHSF